MKRSNSEDNVNTKHIQRKENSEGSTSSAMPTNVSRNKRRQSESFLPSKRVKMETRDGSGSGREVDSSHKDNYSLRCSFCSKEFPSRYKLTRHTMIHTGESSHTCSCCKQSFSEASKLRSHMSLHTSKADLNVASNKSTSQECAYPAVVTQNGANVLHTAYTSLHSIPASTPTTTTEEVQKQCHKLSEHIMIHRHILSRFLPENLQMLEFSLPQEYFNTPTTDCVQKTTYGSNKTEVDADTNIALNSSSLSSDANNVLKIEELEEQKPQTFEQAATAVSSDFCKAETTINGSSENNYAENFVDVKVEDVQELPADLIDKNGLKYEEEIEQKPQSSETTTASVLNSAQDGLCNANEAEKMHAVKLEDLDVNLPEGEVDVKIGVASLPLNDYKLNTVPEELAYADASQLNNLPVADTDISLKDLPVGVENYTQGLSEVEEECNVSIRSGPIYRDDYYEHFSDGSVSSLDDETDKQNLMYFTEMDTLNRAVKFSDVIGLTSQSLTNIEVNPSSRDPIHIDGTSEYIIETFAKKNVDVLYIVWHELFNLDIARSVASNSKNAMLIVKKFEAQQFDLSRLSNTVLHDKIYVSHGQQKFHCFTFGKKLLPYQYDIDVFPNFEKLESALAAFANSHNKSLVHIIDQDWSNYLMKEFKGDIVVPRCSV